MKKILAFLTSLLVYTMGFSQNIGNGSSTPRQQMPVAVTPTITNTVAEITPSDFLIKSKPDGQTSSRKGYLGLGLNYIIALEGTFPGQSAPQAQGPVMGEVKLFAGNNPPYGWAFCQGQLMQVADHPTLFMIIGTTYGGNGKSHFALPDLRNAVPVGVGTA